MPVSRRKWPPYLTVAISVKSWLGLEPNEAAANCTLCIRHDRIGGATSTRKTSAIDFSCYFEPILLGHCSPSRAAIRFVLLRASLWGVELSTHQPGSLGIEVRTWFREIIVPMTFRLALETLKVHQF